MSRESREKLREILGTETQANQSAVDAFDERCAVVLGVNRTDMRCIEYLGMVGASAPTELGAHLGLTTGSVTAMIDRLEKLGYVTRTPDPDDRRRTIVRVTPLVEERAMGLYMPMVHEGNVLTEQYDEKELELLIGFQRQVRQLYERHLERVRAVEPYVKRRR